MSEEAEVFDEETLREVAREKVQRQLALKLHTVVYVLVNVLLVVINFVIARGQNTYLWAAWPLTGWSVGLAFHAVYYALYANGVTSRSKLGVAYHLTAYVTVVAFLVFTNWYTMVGGLYVPSLSPGTTQYQYWWVFWAAIPWAVGLGIHAYLAAHGGSPGEAKPSYVDRKVDREMERIKRQAGGD
ncbi:MAG: 2TM domain-containing protein [Promethearchaeota archaeon]